MSVNLDQRASQCAQQVYFGSHSDDIDRIIADANFSGLQALGPLSKRQAAKAARNSAFCNRTEIFDHLFQNYALTPKTRADCISNFAVFGDVERIQGMLSRGAMKLPDKCSAISVAVRNNHPNVVVALMDGEKIPKETLQTFLKLAEEYEYVNLSGFFRNAIEGYTDS